jgi:hypothetical protein
MKRPNRKPPEDRSTKARPAKVPVRRPNFQPFWTTEMAIEMADRNLAPDAVANAGYTGRIMRRCYPWEERGEASVALAFCRRRGLGRRPWITDISFLEGAPRC